MVQLCPTLNNILFNNPIYCYFKLLDYSPISFLQYYLINTNVHLSLMLYLYMLKFKINIVSNLPSNWREIRKITWDSNMPLSFISTLTSHTNLETFVLYDFHILYKTYILHFRVWMLDLRSKEDEFLEQKTLYMYIYIYIIIYIKY